MSYTNDFERGKDPKRQMGIGRPPTIQQLVEEIFEEYLLKFSDTEEIDFDWDEDLPSNFSPNYVDWYLKATVLCKDKKIRQKMKKMVGGSEGHKGPDFKFWYSIFDLINEKGYDLVWFSASSKGLPIRKGIKIHLEIG